MKVPKDPNLYLTVFTGICVTVVVAFWLLTPVYTPHLEEEIEHTASVKPEQALGQVDAMLTAAEKTLAEMDAEKGGEKAKSQDQATQKPPTGEKPKPAMAVPVSVPDAQAEHGMAGHDMPGYEEPEPEESSHSHEAGGDHGH